MNILEYNTELVNSVVSNLGNVVPGNNESLFSAYDYLYDNTENNIYNSNMSYSGGSQLLATILQQLFSKMSDNETTYNIPPSLSPSSSDRLSPSSSPLVSFLSSSPSDANSYRLLSIISLWFVLIVNPVVILFGVIGNILATYILVKCNIAKLPVSFYTIMLNISDTLNLLIPVFIFWLDNCFNRTPERGYFRDKSNFLCKALMCPDQLFAALSAWYMCAISFNRWYSVCRPSSFFFRTAANLSATTSATVNNNNNNNNNENNRAQKKHSSGSVLASPSLMSFCFPLYCCYCLTRNIKYRQHLQAFRSIGIITLLGILCCLYPIFMHELRPVISTNKHVFDLTHKITHTYAVVWKRCYYSRRHEYAYDIIGIILSSFLHVLPLTFVAAMNIMIIVRLRQRQRLMSVSGHVLESSKTTNNKKVSVDFLQKPISSRLNSSSRKKVVPNKNTQAEMTKLPSKPSLATTHKDQATLTDSPIRPVKSKSSQVIVRLNCTIPRRHHSRDRTITIMLVSVALSYLILTLPYRLFWSYNVYIKRIYPEKLNSSVYLLKMHYIDHVLRTIRNIHYGTNFIFFIFLSKTFRRKFRQLFIGKLLHASNRLFNRNTPATNNNIHNTTKNIKTNHQERFTLNLKEDNQMLTAMNGDHTIGIERVSRNILDETPSLIADALIQEEGMHLIIQLESGE